MSTNDKMGPQECPKCGDTMGGPIWDQGLDALKYRSGCGYTTTIPCRDREQKP